MSQAYQEAVEALAETIDAAHEQAHNHFQPPEVLVLTHGKALLTAIWRAQVAYEAMCGAKERPKPHLGIGDSGDPGLARKATKFFSPERADVDPG